MFAHALIVLALACAPKAPPYNPNAPRSMYEGPTPEATVMPSGLAMQVLRPGTGTEHPGPQSQITVHYSGWTADGVMFDSSYSRGEPLTVGLDEVIPGWTEGVQYMVVGEKSRFWIPAELGYGYGRSPVTGQLLFEIELLGFEP